MANVNYADIAQKLGEKLEAGGKYALNVAVKGIAVEGWAELIVGIAGVIGSGIMAYKVYRAFKEAMDKDQDRMVFFGFATAFFSIGHICITEKFARTLPTILVKINVPEWYLIKAFVQTVVK